MIDKFFQSFFNLLALNPAASICIILGALLLILSSSGQAEIGGVFKMTVDRSGRTVITRIGTLFIVAGLVMVIRPSFPSFPSWNRLSWSSPIDKLHKAATAWDERLGEQAIQGLRKSGGECDQLLADWVEKQLLERGLYGFNDINAVQIHIEQVNPQCRYPLIDHPDQSVQP